MLGPLTSSRLWDPTKAILGKPSPSYLRLSRHYRHTKESHPAGRRGEGGQPGHGHQRMGCGQMSCTGTKSETQARTLLWGATWYHPVEPGSSLANPLAFVLLSGRRVQWRQAVSLVGQLFAGTEVTVPGAGLALWTSRPLTKERVQGQSPPVTRPREGQWARRRTGLTRPACAGQSPAAAAGGSGRLAQQRAGEGCAAGGRASRDGPAPPPASHTGERGRVTPLPCLEGRHHEGRGLICLLPLPPRPWPCWGLRDSCQVAGCPGRRRTLTSEGGRGNYTGHHVASTCTSPAPDGARRVRSMTSAALRAAPACPGDWGPLIYILQVRRG